MCEEKSTDDFASCDFDAFLKSLCRFGSRYQIIENHHFLSLEIVLVDMHVIVSEVRNDVFMWSKAFSAPQSSHTMAENFLYLLAVAYALLAGMQQKTTLLQSLKEMELPTNLAAFFLA